MPLAGPANRQARVAAINLLGGAATFKGVTGTSIVKLFDKAAGITGLSLKAARQANLKVLTSTTADYHHASYYPDAEMLVIKLVFLEGSGKLIGAQVIGAAQGGVDKRLDVLATAIQAGMTVQDLSELDLVYAPPFGSANDPVNVAGSVAQHILLGDWKHLESVQDLPANALLIDVRDEDEIELSGKLAGALHIPLGTIRDRLAEIPSDRPVVLYCAKGLRGYLALRILAGNGRKNLYNLSGGFRRAAASGWPVQK
jgi:rhodanese-related sulfurtransferase